MSNYLIYIRYLNISEDMFNNLICVIRRNAVVILATPKHCRFRLAEPLVHQIFDLMVGRGGLEPPPSRLSGVRSNHLSYRPAGKSLCDLPSAGRILQSNVREARDG